MFEEVPPSASGEVLIRRPLGRDIKMELYQLLKITPWEGKRGA
jgi:hypothetical protein